ncbi:hypothetical protein [Novosphingopyxis sp.]|uniref:hypothetical protein n=1 Tax=Novosphingopyxis sp. TaxID=2709690 RepID=UPI003B5B1693
MRRAVPSVMLLLAASALLGACEQEPDFDEQYDRTAEEIEARAKQLDADLAAQMKSVDADIRVNRPLETSPAARPTATPAKR